MAVSGDSLEALLNQATNPSHSTENKDLVEAFCERVNNELEGPQIALPLIAHKIQSPQTQEALLALATLEGCVKNCGRKFHQELAKFRFLNEIIKVVSPKYLGNKAAPSVKKKCIELMYSWSKGLPHESKISEAYKMLKQQGIVKEDPTYMDEQIVQVPKPKPRVASFEDEDKSKLLAKLLASKDPNDLQAANRLIKNMVKQDESRMEKISRRINEIKKIDNNVKLLQEMIEHYNPGTSSQSDKEMMKELYDDLEKMRPSLFRLASDADDKDNDGINEILRANDEVMKVMSLYKKEVDSSRTGYTDQELKGNAAALLDLALDNTPSQQPASTPQHSFENELDKQLNSLDLGGHTNHTADSLLTDLDDIFSAASTPSTNMGSPGSMLTSPGQQFPGSQGSGMTTPSSSAVPVMSTMPFQYPGQGGVSLPSTGQQAFSPSFSQPNPTVNNISSTGLASPMNKGAKGLDDLDLLGQDLLQQSLPTGKDGAKVSQSEFPVPHQKLKLNQIQSAQKQAVNTSSSSSEIPRVPHPPVPSIVPSPNKLPQLLPLTDVFVPLEKITPGSGSPLNAYDKNGLKIVIHVCTNKPREDVSVTVISVISTNSNPVNNFMFQAAVPKIMKVKLQPPSSTELPAYNPVLPPSAISQVMLFANPQKEKVRLKFKITYKIKEQLYEDVGELDNVLAT